MSLFLPSLRGAAVRCAAAGIALLIALGCGGAGAQPRQSSPAPADDGIDHRYDVIGNVDFRQIPVVEAARLASELARVNIVATNAVADVKVTLFLRRTTVQAMIDSMARAAGLWYRYDKATKTYLLMTAEEFRRDVVIYRADNTQIFSMKYYNVVSAAAVVRALFGRRVTLTPSVEEPLGISALGSPLSQRRTQTGSGSGTYASGSGTSSGRGSSGSSSGFGSQGGSGFGSSGAINPLAFTPNFSTPAAAGSGAGSEAGATLENLSLGRAGTIDNITEGSVSRVSRAELESLDQTREAPIYLTYNRLHNLLIVRSGDEQAIGEITALINRIDRPARQVMLEVKILELSMGDSFQSAFEFGYSNGANSFNFASGSSIDTSGSGGIFQAISSHLTLRLQALQSTNRVKVLAAPVLMASNNQPSRLFVGSEQVLTVGVSSQTTVNNNLSSTSITPTTEQRDVGNQLIIIPRINDDRTVTLSIDHDSSTVNKGGSTIPVSTGSTIVNVPIDVVETANMQATVLAKDGYTAAVGGLIRDSETTAVKKVPVLGDIPVVGFFFRSGTGTDPTKAKSEIVLLITPRILQTAEEGETAARNYLLERSSQAPGVIDQAVPAAGTQPAGARPVRPQDPPPPAPPYYFDRFEDKTQQPAPETPAPQAAPGS